MDSLNRLQEIFGHFPGIGPRQARRFVYHLQTKSPSYIKSLIDAIEEVRKTSSECASCHRFFVNNNLRHESKMHICSICADKNRDNQTLMVVSRDSDFESVEKSGAYKGLYFILGGTVPVLDSDPEKRIRLKSLLTYVQNLNSESNSLKEIILSLNPTPEGEHTADVVKSALEKLNAGKPIKITVLGRGLSTGAELEYVDGETIRNALQNRH